MGGGGVHVVGWVRAHVCVCVVGRRGREGMIGWEVEGVCMWLGGCARTCVCVCSW